MKTRSVEVKAVELLSDIFKPIIFYLEKNNWPSTLNSWINFDDPTSVGIFTVELIHWFNFFHLIKLV